MVGEGKESHGKGREEQSFASGTVTSICFQHCEGPKSLPSPCHLSFPPIRLPSPLLPSFSHPLRSSPLNPASGSGESCKLSGVWGEAPAANDFGAFWGWRNAAGGIQYAGFKKTETGFSLNFYEEIFQEIAFIL